MQGATLTLQGLLLRDFSSINPAEINTWIYTLECIFGTCLGSQITNVFIYIKFTVDPSKFDSFDFSSLNSTTTMYIYLPYRCGLHNRPAWCIYLHKNRCTWGETHAGNTCQIGGWTTILTVSVDLTEGIMNLCARPTIIQHNLVIDPEVAYELTKNHLANGTW